jgi:hypothetical protein
MFEGGGLGGCGQAGGELLTCQATSIRGAPMAGGAWALGSLPAPCMHFILAPPCATATAWQLSPEPSVPVSTHTNSRWPPSPLPALLQVHTYGVRGGQHLQQVSLGSECEQEGVVDAVVFPTGVVAMSPLGHLWYVVPWCPRHWRGFRVEYWLAKYTHPAWGKCRAARSCTERGGGAVWTDGLLLHCVAATRTRTVSAHLHG